MGLKCERSKKKGKGFKRYDKSAPEVKTSSNKYPKPEQNLRIIPFTYVEIKLKFSECENNKVIITRFSTE